MNAMNLVRQFVDQHQKSLPNLQCEFVRQGEYKIYIEDDNRGLVEIARSDFNEAVRDWFNRNYDVAVMGSIDRLADVILFTIPKRGGGGDG